MGTRCGHDYSVEYMKGRTSYFVLYYFAVCVVLIYWTNVNGLFHYHPVISKKLLLLLLLWYVVILLFVLSLSPASAEDKKSLFPSVWIK